MISQTFVEEQSARYARKMDIDPPRLLFKERSGKKALQIRLRFGTLEVPLACLQELSESELTFAIALAFARHLRIPIVNLGYLIAPLVVGTFLGWLIVASLQNFFLDYFWFGFAVIFGMCVIGYTLGLVLFGYFRLKMHDAIFHDALNLTGNAAAAESYLIRAQAGELQGRRRTLSSRERDRLSHQLRSLQEAALTLGLDYRPVSD